MRFKSQTAFTLIELSIVLVIIGLIAGGILFGRELIINAKNMRFASQITETETLFNTFKLKYNYLPGDFPQADQIWGVRCIKFPWAADCSGNGDGYFNDEPNGISASLSWEHLYLAGLTDIHYIPIQVSWAPDYNDFRSRPPYKESVFKDGYLGMFYTTLAGKTANWLRICGNFWQSSAWNGDCNIPPIPSQTSRYIDIKFDDGQMNTGRVRGDIGWPNFNCSYTGNDSDPVCILGYQLQ